MTATRQGITFKVSYGYRIVRKCNIATKKLGLLCDLINRDQTRTVEDGENLGSKLASGNIDLTSKTTS